MKPVVIVTGGSRGIGLAIVKRFGLAGMNVAIAASGNEERYKETLAELTAAGVDWMYVQTDISSAADRAQLVQKTVERWGRIDVLVNNAGVGPLERVDLLEMSEESFDRVVGINTKGPLFLSQLVVKQMLEQDVLFKKRGTIVNVSSISAVVSSPNRGEYCISKAAVSMMTTLFADRFAAEGIFVQEVRPGVIATDMTSKVQDKYDQLFADGRFPVARWGTPDDVANAVFALASDDFLYSTGTVVNVDGGFHIQSL